jgi:D-alanyl-D-alanine carboxypeptidase
LAIIFSSCADGDSTEPIDDELIKSKLQEIVNSKIGEDKLVGVSISIRVDGVERWSLQGGLSKFDQPIESNMKFGIGSITKNMGAAAVLILVDEETLSLDDTIGDWLDLNSANVNNEVTIFQLLNHFTGINGYLQPELWERVEANLDTPIPQIELVDYIGMPSNEPGVTHEYSIQTIYCWA